MFVENSSQNEKKIPCSPILGHFFLVDDKIISIGTASALVLYTKMQHFVDVNLIKIDYSDDQKKINFAFFRNILLWHFHFFNGITNGMM